MDLKEQLKEAFPDFEKNQDAITCLAQAMYESIDRILVEQIREATDNVDIKKIELKPGDLSMLFADSLKTMGSHIILFSKNDPNILDQAAEKFISMKIEDIRNLFNIMLPKALIDSNSHTAPDILDPL